MSTIAASKPAHGAAMTGEERNVIFASSLGTVFEWYDFYLYGSLASVISKQFFSAVNPTAAFIFALLAFAAGFAVRPFGALVFGRLGDLVGRKYTFLVTIVLMGGSTFVVGILPSYASIGILAPIALISMRLIQGLALGGEYGGAATYTGEHAPQGKRGLYTAWIQTTATLGLFLSLLVILGCRTLLSPADFDAWGWRIPFLVSVLLVAISVWIRLKLQESPLFLKMKSEGKGSKSPLRDSFTNWTNLRLVLIALFGLTAGQAVVWYTGQFYALFFLTHAVLHRVRCAVRSDRPQVDHSGRVFDRRTDVLPIVPRHHALRKSRARVGDRRGACRCRDRLVDVLGAVQSGRNDGVHVAVRYCEGRASEARRAVLDACACR
jgi:MFS family permease